jgi:hypothetical protein
MFVIAVDARAKVFPTVTYLELRKFSPCHVAELTVRPLDFFV